jgi:hypothetical protein
MSKFHKQIHIDYPLMWNDDYDGECLEGEKLEHIEKYGLLEIIY